MRSVAARAGASVAQVQYYFHSRAELISAAFDHASTEFLATLQTVRSGELSLQRLRDIVWLWLPLDLDREKRARVWLAYAATAATDENLAAASARLDADLRDWFTDQLEALQRTGLIRPGGNPRDTAARLLAMVDGVTVHCLVLPVEARPALAERVIGMWLDQLASPDPLPQSRSGPLPG